MALPDPVWVFGYGSLIWRPGFEFAEQARAHVVGHARRFWQASHDHRGTIENPGRVVTLVPAEQQACEGMVYRLHKVTANEVLALLDEREQDGYERVCIDAVLADGRSVSSITWIAAEGNASWAGELPLSEMATQIATRHGPSGSNADYLLRLAEHLVEMDINDEHVQLLASEVRKLYSSE